jgi:hypothetical protein
MNAWCPQYMHLCHLFPLCLLARYPMKSFPCNLHTCMVEILILPWFNNPLPTFRFMSLHPFQYLYMSDNILKFSAPIYFDDYQISTDFPTVIHETIDEPQPLNNAPPARSNTLSLSSEMIPFKVQGDMASPTFVNILRDIGGDIGGMDIPQDVNYDPLALSNENLISMVHQLMQSTQRLAQSNERLVQSNQTLVHAVEGLTQEVGVLKKEVALVKSRFVSFRKWSLTSIFCYSPSHHTYIHSSLLIDLYEEFQGHLEIAGLRVCRVQPKLFGLVWVEGMPPYIPPYIPPYTSIHTSSIHTSIHTYIHTFPALLVSESVHC